MICFQINHGHGGGDDGQHLNSRWMSEEEEERTRFTKVIRDRPRKAVRPLVMLWFHVEAQGGRRVQTYRRKR